MNYEETDVDKRMDANDEKIDEKIQERARRHATLDDFIFDQSRNRFWDRHVRESYDGMQVDSYIPHDLWPRDSDVPDAPAAPAAPAAKDDDDPPEENSCEGAPPADGKKKRGRPRKNPDAHQKKKKPKLIRPSVVMANITWNNGQQYVESAVWSPGDPEIIQDKFVNSDGEMTDDIGRRIFNMYRPPRQCVSNKSEGAQPWIDLVMKLFPGHDGEDLLDRFAHTIQHPSVKVNGAIALVGEQGIGKDSIIAPMMRILTPNAKTITPDQVLSEFMPFLRSQFVLISEVRPTEPSRAVAFYEVLKMLSASPPEYLGMNKKFQDIAYVKNVMTIVMTMNSANDLYIPDGDRRIVLLLSPLKAKWHIAEGEPDYFEKFFEWLDDGGDEEVGAYLATRDISSFKPKGEHIPTEAHRSVTATWGEPEDGVMFALDKLTMANGGLAPDIVFGNELTDETRTGLNFEYASEIRAMMKSPRKLAHRMTQAGYVMVSPPAWVRGEAKDTARWRLGSVEERYESRTAFARIGIDVASRVDMVVAHGVKLGKERAEMQRAGHMLRPVNAAAKPPATTTTVADPDAGRF